MTDPLVGGPPPPPSLSRGAKVPSARERGVATPAGVHAHARARGGAICRVGSFVIICVMICMQEQERLY